MNIVEIFQKFPDQESCIRHLEKVRWGDTPVCAYCGSDNTYPLRGELRHHCNACRRSFSVTVGTIFFDTRLPMQKWFLAISLMLNAKKGISSRQLARDLDLPVKTAWSVGHRIRKAMKDDGALLCGVVEMDETYVGGKPRPMNNKDDNTPSPGGPGGRTPVVGMVERGGKVKATKVSKYDVNAREMAKLVRGGIDLANSILMTDESHAYNRANEFLPHRKVSHSKQYVNGIVHTNSIESFWAILKRGIMGQFHKVSEKYLDRYVDEFAYRYNGRLMDGKMLFDKTIGRMLVA